MKLLHVLLIAAVLVSSAGCSASNKAQASRSSMSKCQEDLKTIPEVAAFLKARGREPEIGQRPLEGMEIALTINRMVRAKIDPEANEDDLCYTENTRENFDRLVAALKENNLPPTVDFITGHALDPELQEEWLRSGNLLGNMTYGRYKPKKGSAEDFIENVSRNEALLAPMTEKFTQKRKYFRFPGLKLDEDGQKLDEIRAYLKEKGYAEVPATIDARDELFSQSYCAALARGDQTCASYIKATFKSLLLDKTMKAREVARESAGREIKHILMVKANQLMCDTLGEVLAWYKALGARFVSIDEALADHFYVERDPGRAANDIIELTMSRQMDAAEPRQKSE